MSINAVQLMSAIELMREASRELDKVFTLEGNKADPRAVGRLTVLLDDRARQLENDSGLRRVAVEVTNET